MLVRLLLPGALAWNVTRSHDFPTSSRKVKICPPPAATQSACICLEEIFTDRYAMLITASRVRMFPCVRIGGRSFIGIGCCECQHLYVSIYPDRYCRFALPKGPIFKKRSSVTTIGTLLVARCANPRWNSDYSEQHVWANPKCIQWNSQLAHSCNSKLLQCPYFAGVCWCGN